MQAKECQGTPVRRVMERILPRACRVSVALPIPRLQISGLQTVRIDFCFLSHSVCGTVMAAPKPNTWVIQQCPRTHLGRSAALDLVIPNSDHRLRFPLGRTREEAIMGHSGRMTAVIINGPQATRPSMSGEKGTGKFRFPS